LKIILLAKFHYKVTPISYTENCRHII